LSEGQNVIAEARPGTMDYQIARGTSSTASGWAGKAREASARSYGIALSFVGVALVATLLVQRFFPYPFLFLFFAAVMASAWFGGTVPGLFAVFASTLSIDYFFVPPYYSFSVNATEGTYFGAFIICALVASWVSASKKKSEEALKSARDQLEIRVAERTAELKRSNTELRDREHQLFHLSRVLTMGELSASIAHEINQPLSAVVTYGHSCLEWLSANPPNLDEARQAADRIIQDGTRAGAVLGQIRAHFKKEPLAKDWLDLNEIIRELTIFLRDEATGRQIEIRTELTPDLPKVKGDRVQLQQVLLNLMMNGVDAMSETSGRPRELRISSRMGRRAEILILVEDSGIGLSAEGVTEIFRPFFTTKQQGIGMGLSISRSIVESHAGRLWAAPRAGGGAILQFTLPTGEDNDDDD
jgi:C4-dicarboxylate-specific signal transduction histidine kinase